MIPVSTVLIEPDRGFWVDKLLDLQGLFSPELLLSGYFTHQCASVLVIMAAVRCPRKG